MNQKSTMSVREMGRSLGLKKTDSYYLIHKGWFDTVQINGMTRVVIKSFEDWYAGQIRYSKIDGTPPGQRLRASYYSIRDFGEVFGFSNATAYEVIKREHIPTVLIDGWKYIPKKEFNSWYASQSRYRTVEDKKKVRLEDSSLSCPEIASLLGIHREEVYRILRKNPNAFQIIIEDGRKKVTWRSFEDWYASQDTYIKISERPDEPPAQEASAQPEETPAQEISERPSEDPPKKLVDPNKISYTVEEAASLLDVDKADIYLLIKQKLLPAKKYGKSMRISRDAINCFLSQQGKSIS